MDFSLSEDQKMLQKTAREFLEAECTEKFVRQIEAGDTGYSPAQWKKIAELGWLGLLYPEKYGGADGSILDLCVIFEEMGRFMFPSPYMSTVVLCGLVILMTGNEEQKEKYIPKIVQGDSIMALALTESAASWNGKAWNPEGVTVTAIPQGDDYIIDGTKIFVHDAKIADEFLCVTRTASNTSPKDGVTLFLIDAKSPGITCNLLATTAGDKQCEVLFNKVKVPKNNIVGKLNKGWTPLENVIKQGAVLLCAQMVGANRRLLELSVDYAKTRIQFEQPIGVNQYVQDHCVMILADSDSSWWLTYYAAWKLKEGMPAYIDVAAAKAWVSDAHERVCWHAHQIFGGVGYTINDGVIPMYSRRGKTLQLHLGDSEHYLEKIACELEKMPKPPQPRGKTLKLWDDIEEQCIPEWFEDFVKGHGMSFLSDRP